MTTLFGVGGATYPTSTTHITPTLYATNVKTLAGGNFFGVEQYPNIPANSVAVEFANACQNAGIVFEVRQMGPYSGSDWSDSMHRLTYERAKVYLNIGGAQTTYINNLVAYQTALHADIQAIMYEPNDYAQTLNQYSGAADAAILADIQSWGTSQEAFFTAYHNFCRAAVNALKSIDSNVKVALCTMPFTNSLPLIQRNYVIVEDRVLYEVNDHYLFRGGPPSNYGDNRAWVNAYYNNGIDFTTDAQRQVAKNELYIYYDTYRIKPLRDVGVDVIVGEWGGTLTNPNGYAHMHDFMDYCDDRGVYGHCWFGWNIYHPPPLSESSGHNGLGLLDGVLATEVYPCPHNWARLALSGEYWKDEVLARIGAGVILPYHNALASLDNLSIINGTWSAP